MGEMAVHMWHAKSVESISSELGTSLETGLSSEEAQRRLLEYGPTNCKNGPDQGSWKDFGGS